MTEPPGFDPLPPRATGWPLVGSGPALLRNPTAFFAAQRRALGDTFRVDAFGYRLFCVFSAEGVRQLYAAPEAEASFGLATYSFVFKHKTPPELLAGRRHRPHDLFGGEEVEFYLQALEDAVADEIAELGDSGRIEAFALARRLGHRLGLACWAGREASRSERLDRLIPLFDRLDSSNAFVRPLSTFASIATRRHFERRALRAIEREFADILARRAHRGERPGDFLDRVHDAFADLPDAERAIHTARDLILIHMGAQSNLPAALAWTLVDLLLRPALAERVRAGDTELLERCANESIRLAQRSLTLRQVLRPFDLDDGQQKWRLAPGVLLATMLSVTNPTAGPGLDAFDPDHYSGRRLAPDTPVPARELVSTFGHGRHSCPAQRFSIAAIRVAVAQLLECFEIEPLFEHAEPRRRQIGGVSRAENPCPVAYRRRTSRGRPAGSTERVSRMTRGDPATPRSSSRARPEPTEPIEPSIDSRPGTHPLLDLPAQRFDNAQPTRHHRIDPLRRAGITTPASAKGPGIA